MNICMNISCVRGKDCKNYVKHYKWEDTIDNVRNNIFCAVYDKSKDYCEKYVKCGDCWMCSKEPECKNDSGGVS